MRMRLRRHIRPTRDPYHRLGAVGSRVGGAGGGAQTIRFCCHTRTGCLDRAADAARPLPHVDGAGLAFPVLQLRPGGPGKYPGLPTSGPVKLREPGQCFAAFLAFFPLRLTLPTSFLVLPLTALASRLAFLPRPMTGSFCVLRHHRCPIRTAFPAEPPETRCSNGSTFHAGRGSNLPDITPSALLASAAPGQRGKGSARS